MTDESEVQEATLNRHQLRADGSVAIGVRPNWNSPPPVRVFRYRIISFLLFTPSLLDPVPVPVPVPVSGAIDAQQKNDRQR